MSQQDMDRTAYLEARVGELHQKIGDLRGELERERASRRDWAAEAMRLQETAAADSWACDRCMAADPEEPLCDADRRPFTFCSCLTPEGAAFVAAQPKWSLPLCAVHPEVER